MTSSVEPRLQSYFFLGIFLLVLVVNFFMFWSFLAVLALAAIAAVALWPVYLAVRRWFGLGPRLGSFVVILLVLFVVAVLVSFVSSRVFFEAQNLYLNLDGQSLAGAGNSYLDRLTALLERPIRNLWPQFSLDLRAYLNQGLEWSFAHLGTLFSGTVSLGFKTLLWFLALFYFLKDGNRLVKTLIELSPLGDLYDQHIINRLHGTINAVTKGFLAVAVIQGLLAGVGLSLFGVPNATLWGAVAAFAALVPGLGTALVMVPAVIYLWFSGSMGAAVGLLVWSAAVVGLVDNFLAPYLYSRGGQIHPLFMLFAVLGGLLFFGPAGFILGPVSLSLLFALLDVYRRNPQVLRV